MHCAGRILHALGQFLLRRARQAEMAVGFRLEGGDRHRPEPRAPADALADLRHIDIGRARHRARTIEPFDTLDRRDLCYALPP